MTLEKHGIDLSKWNPVTDWDKVKNSGYADFVIMRAGYGLTNIDPKVEEYTKACEARDIPYGYYWFSYSYTPEMARKEASRFIQFLADKKPLYPCYYDFEYDGVRYAKSKGVNLTKDTMNQMAYAFLDTLESAGYYTGIYGNTDYFKNIWEPALKEKYTHWWAQWTGKPKEFHPIWQYTDSGEVPGITGKVDRDISYVDFPTTIRKMGLNGFHTTEAGPCDCECACCRAGGCDGVDSR